MKEEKDVEATDLIFLIFCQALIVYQGFFFANHKVNG
jgi:hypothetical protein